MQEQIEHKPIELYEELDIDVKEKISKKEMEVLISNVYIIHSKFYLLWNDNGDNRIILGSANLSNQAFNDNTNQFENIVVYDNSKLFDEYKKYYDLNLSKILHSYFPQELLKINTKNVLKLKEADVDTVIILTNDEIEKIMQKAPIETLKDVNDKIALGICDKNILTEMDNLESDRNKVKKEEKEKIERENISYEIVKEAINKRTNEPKIKTEVTLNNMVKTKLEKIIVKKAETRIDRNMLINKKNLRNIRNGTTGLFIPSIINENTLTPFGENISKEKLAESLKLLNKYMQGFEKYANSYSDDYGKRIFESILCAFTSPFIYEIRNKLEIEENRLDVPQFVFIGGEGGSGKSSLLSVISKLLGIDKGKYLLWEDLLGTSGRQKKDRLDLIQSWVFEDNVNPILIDEIDGEFFTKVSYGRDFIVNISNQNIKRDEPYPIIIGTTNTKSYTLPKEAKRRSYYLIIDRILNNTTESIDYFKEIYDSFTSDLFKDFCVRMCERLENSDNYTWNYYTETNNFDFLYNTRQIFMDYYKLAEIPLPRYFPEKKHNDDSETNKEKWRKLYLGSKDEFIYDKETKHLFFKIVALNSTDKQYGPNTSQIYADALPQDVTVGRVNSVTTIELITDKFFEWIEVDNPYGTLFQKLKGFIKK
ncbi:restriction endonuclease PLD domain-containing protein [uncultured Sneathia sp.]|uniref:restriction endonuclease PLD domain-containing protein n=1 Tax=uncultured Sneathia sp. TaxID=278067 RepID=UPI00338E33D1